MAQTKLFYLFWTIFWIVGGGVGCSLYGLGRVAFGSWDSAMESEMLTKAHVWSILVLLPVLAPMAKVARVLNRSFLADFSQQESLKEAIRGSWTNTGLVSALIFTIGAALWAMDRPGEMADPATQWFFIFAFVSSLLSGLATTLTGFFVIQTDGFSDKAIRELVRQHDALLGYPMCLMVSSLIFVALSLATFTYLQYGVSALLTATMWLMAAAFFASWEYNVVAGFENTVDGKRTTLADSARCDIEMHRSWIYAGGEMEGHFVPEETIGKIFPQCDKCWCWREGVLEEIQETPHYVQRKVEEGYILKAVVGDLPVPYRKVSPVGLLLDGTLIPEPATGYFVMVTASGEKVSLLLVNDSVETSGRLSANDKL